jgi:deoxyribodipyrimidine photo-lyase
MDQAIRKHSPVIVWFRDDLRLADNPALVAASASGGPLICIFVYDEASAGTRRLGGAARWFLHGALAALNDELVARGGELILLQGAAEQQIMDCVASLSAGGVMWNRRYDAAGRRIDAAVEAALKRAVVEVETFGANLLHEPWNLTTKSGGSFQVFSAFWRAALARGEPAPPMSVPERFQFHHIPDRLRQMSKRLEALALEPHKPDWAAGLRATWTRSEAAAQARLSAFLADGFANYAQGRDRPDTASTSRLSPYLRFGMLSPRQIWHAVSALKDKSIGKENREKLLSEIGWREFSYHLLYHHPDLAQRNLRAGMEMNWREDRRALRAWQRGQTGYPIVDAGMRELWQTGWMHNRVRMICASFLIKDLLIDWREGEAWFWDTLVDADPASNAASWQWVAGTGADAAPFFRIFNPVLQGQKFDPDGAYVKRYVPELAGLPPALIHAPLKAASMELAAAGIKLGETYPLPIVDHDEARKRALEVWEAR